MRAPPEAPMVSQRLPERSMSAAEFFAAAERGERVLYCTRSCTSGTGHAHLYCTSLSGHVLYCTRSLGALGAAAAADLSSLKALDVREVADAATHVVWLSAGRTTTQVRKLATF
jgi:hypothetical protein